MLRSVILPVSCVEEEVTPNHLFIHYSPSHPPEAAEPLKLDSKKVCKINRLDFSPKDQPCKALVLSYDSLPFPKEVNLFLEAV